MNVCFQNFGFRKFRSCKAFEGIIQKRTWVRVYICFLGYLCLYVETLRNTIIVQQFVVIFFHCFRIYERRFMWELRWVSFQDLVMSRTQRSIRVDKYGPVSKKQIMLLTMPSNHQFELTKSQRFDGVKRHQGHQKSFMYHSL